MWLLISLLSVAGFGAYAAIDRWEGEWHGTPSGRGRFRVWAHKDRVRLLRVGIATSSALDFELKRETWIDGLAKMIGIAVEPQVGRLAFDRQVYIIADDARLAPLLRDDPALRLRVGRICSAQVQGFRFHRLVCRRGQIWLQLRPKGATSGQIEAVRWALEELEALSQSLPALEPWKEPALDRKFLYAVVLAGSAWGLLFNACVQFVRLRFGDVFPKTYDLDVLSAQALPLVALVVAGLGFATLLLLGRSARVHLVLMEVVLVGGFGALGTVPAVLKDLNMQFDRGPVAAYEVEVLGKHHKQGHSNRHLQLSNWVDQKPNQVLVDRETYDRVEVGDLVTVRQWPGRLGIRWVESVTPVSAGDDASLR